jgi:hypothetical protein
MSVLALARVLFQFPRASLFLWLFGGTLAIPIMQRYPTIRCRFDNFGRMVGNANASNTDAADP